MRRFGAAAAAFAVLAALPGTAAAEPRAFQLLGYDSALRLTDATPTVVDTAVLPNGDIALLNGESGEIRILDTRGALRPLARLAGEAPFSYDLDLAPDGTLLVSGADGLWRVTLDGSVSLLRRGGEPAEFSTRIAAADPLPDGTILMAVGNRIVRRAPDGAETVVAGTGSDEAAPRPGPATASALPQPTEVAATPDGGFLVGLYDTIWRVDAAGQLTKFADGLSEIGTIEGDPAGQVLVVAAQGVVALRGGRKVELVHGDERVRPPYWPVWSGGPLRRTWLEVSGGATRTPDGGWLIGTDRGVALITGADERSDRLAVAVEPSTQASAAQGVVSVRATRAASFTLRARQRYRTVTETAGELVAGTNRIRLPRRLPPGVVDLQLGATAPDGAVAKHTLTVLGTRLLTKDVAARSVAAFRQSQTGQSVVTAHDCRRRSRTALSCLVVVGSEEGGFSRRYLVALRADGWLYAVAGPVRQRIELLPRSIVN
jgi:hypothetical protein